MNLIILNIKKDICIYILSCCCWLSNDYSVVSDENCLFPTPPTSLRSTHTSYYCLHSFHLYSICSNLQLFYYILSFLIIFRHGVTHCIIKHHLVLFIYLSLFYHFLHHLFIFFILYTQI